MVTSLLPNPVASPTTRKSVQPLASEFRLLGLRPREARLDVIRGAVKETASEVKSADEWSAGDSGQVARVAVAGYRLLDPRRRATLFERVQLLLWVDEELATPSVALWDAVPQAPGTVLATAVGSPLPPPVTPPPVTAPPIAELATVNQAARDERQSTAAFDEVARTEETQVALDLFRSIRKRDRRAMALWVSIAALALSLLLTVGLVVSLI
jgi:hypothetical protein